MKFDLKTLKIKEAVMAMTGGDFTAVELADGYLAEIQKRDKNLHAYLEVYDDVVLQAKSADRRIKGGRAGLLSGIPVALKDNILIKGRRAGAASRILENYVASYDATVISKLKEAGAVFIGRTNMDEFAMGSSTENSAFGPTKNPHDYERVAGGSSGGSAAAVAADMALAALGSDTGGSIRQPASFCGVVGFKPSYGSVSRNGLMAMGSSLDVIGPITKTVSDAEIIFNVISGADPLDSTSFSVSESSKEKSGRKLRVADLTDYINGVGGVDSEVMKKYRAALGRFAELGHEIKKLKSDLSALRQVLAVYYILMPAEVSTNLARFDGVKYGFFKAGNDLLEDYKLTRGLGFGPEARRRILLGTYVLSAGYYDSYYGKASAVRRLIKKTFDKIFNEVDLVATPTTPTPAFKVAEKTANPVLMYLSDIFTVTANIIGSPAISLPVGFSETKGNRLPIGFQIMASHGNDRLLLSAAKNFLGEN
jgi:aspartyl-tRNA(Asn)/glutamyl-tRNA(Gln) amidotransferase subunit A